MTKDFLFPMGISAVVATVLTPSLGTQKDLHASLRVQAPREVSVSQVTENTPHLSLMNHQNDFIGFKEKMGYRESRNNYFITNPYGHVGKYQFGKSALKFYGVSQSEFLSSPALQESLGITTNETMAFGDYLNDLELLARATYSYAMKNAQEEVKQVATYQTEEDNDHDGVLKTIVRELKINLNS